MRTRPTFDPYAWARTQPHSFYSMWPKATHTKCDYCGVYMKDHAPDVPEDVDVARDPLDVVSAEVGGHALYMTREDAEKVALSTTTAPGDEAMTEAEARAIWGDR